MRKDIVEETSALSNFSLCFIDRLPTETLEDIFIHGAHDYYSTANGDPISSAPKWVNVSYVNHYWRDVALNCSILWTYLFNASPRWTEELLVRSKRALLKFRMGRISHLQNKRQACFLEQVINHAERFQEAGLPLSPSSYHLVSKLPSPAPHLRVLALSGPPPFVPDWAVQIVPQPFIGDTPALPIPSYSMVPWNSFKYFSRLTSLSICHVLPQVQQSTQEFLTMLRCMQDLTHLCLDKALPSAAVFLSSTAFHTFQKISLPHLSRLSISGRITTVVALLSCMDIPWKAELELTCDYNERVPSDNYYTLLSSLFAQRVDMYNDQASCSQSISCLLVSFPRQDRVHVAFGTSGYKFPLRTFCSIPWRSRERLATRLCFPARLSNIQKVHMTYPPPLQAFWTDVLGHLPGLRCLELKRGRMPPITNLLSFAPRDGTENQSEDPREGENQMYAPGLEVLELENIQFSALPEVDCNMPDTLRASTLQSLYDAFSTRKDARIRIRMIRCSERGPDVPKNKLDDVVGWWKDGRFCVDG